jgi:hypothetical protein
MAQSSLYHPVDCRSNGCQSDNPGGQRPVVALRFGGALFPYGMIDRIFHRTPPVIQKSKGVFVPLLKIKASRNATEEPALAERAEISAQKPP